MQERICRLSDAFQQTEYIADYELIVTLAMAEQLGRPVLLEGESGVGKTKIAKVLADVYTCPLIRLQCYDGLDICTSTYEWNYTKQLLEMQHRETDNKKPDVEIFSEQYLLERPLLKAIRQDDAPVLLIDEIDRSDEAFEAFLMELLSDFQITIPELGTFSAKKIPHVIITSNATRELSDALRRRCLYYYLDYPGIEKETQIICSKLPGINQNFAKQIAQFLYKLRSIDLEKIPGVAETLDWSQTLMMMSISDLNDNKNVIYHTRSCLLKTKNDTDKYTVEALNDLLVSSL